MHASSINNRETYWDTVKALLIFLVVFGHVIQFFIYQAEGSNDFWTDSVFKCIYLFHMPLFMFISGYFAAKSTSMHSWRSLTRYAWRLIPPCLSMGILLFLMSILKEQATIFAFYNGCTALWFLVVIFECLFFYLIMQLNDSWWYRSVAFISPILLALLIGNIPIMRHLWAHHHHFTYMWPIFVLGSYSHSLNFTSAQINWKWCAFLLPFVFLYCFFHSTWYVYLTPLKFNIKSFLIDLYRTLTAIAGSGVFLWLCKYVHRFIGKYSVVKNIGKATLALYVLQTVFFCKYEIIAPWLYKGVSYMGAFILSILLLGGFYASYAVISKVPFASLLLFGDRCFIDNKMRTQKYMNE
ncbi:MAG: acyltransferase family protein [Akkermansia sp.]|nr:acyltransferase family protein [Akkermansia sp.]